MHSRDRLGFWIYRKKKSGFPRLDLHIPNDTTAFPSSSRHPPPFLPEQQHPRAAAGTSLEGGGWGAGARWGGWEGGGPALDDEEVLDEEALRAALAHRELPRVRVEQVEHLLVVDLEARRPQHVPAVRARERHIAVEAVDGAGHDAVLRERPLSARVALAGDDVLGAGDAVRLAAAGLAVGEERGRVAREGAGDEGADAAVLEEGFLVALLVEDVGECVGARGGRAAEVLHAAAGDAHGLAVLEAFDDLFVAAGSLGVVEGSHPENYFDVFSRVGYLWRRFSVFRSTHHTGVCTGHGTMWLG